MSCGKPSKLWLIIATSHKVAVRLRIFW
jgi:hypothetical protein